MLGLAGGLDEQIVNRFPGSVVADGDPGMQDEAVTLPDLLAEIGDVGGENGAVGDGDNMILVSLDAGDVELAFQHHAHGLPHLNHIPHPERTGIGQADTGDQVGNSRRGPQGKEHAHKNGNAFESWRVGAGNIRIGDYRHEGQDEHANDSIGDGGNLGVQPGGGDFTRTHLVKEVAQALQDVPGDKKEHGQKDQGGSLLPDGLPHGAGGSQYAVVKFQGVSLGGRKETQTQVNIDIE